MSLANCAHPPTHRRNVFIRSDDKHLLIGAREERRTNILLFAEHFLNPYIVIRPETGKMKRTKQTKGKGTIRG